MDREYTRAHREQIKARQREWYEANRLRVIAKSRKNHLKNRAKRLVDARTRYAMNRDACLEKCREWVSKNRDKSASIKASYRARKKNAHVEDVSKDAVYERDGGRCYLCRKRITKKQSHVEHVRPLSRGGRHSYVNVRLSCRTCNLRKGKKTLQEYKASYAA